MSGLFEELTTKEKNLMDDNVQKKEMLSILLFINIKWNQEPGTEDLEHRNRFQIGVIAADRNMQKIKIFQGESDRISKVQIQ